MSDQTITCENCKEEYELKPNLVSLDKGKGVTQWGIRCPTCGLFTHSYFEDDDVRAARQKLQAFLERFQKEPAGKKEKLFGQFTFQKKVYARIFNQEQTRLRRKYNLPVKELA